MDTLRKLEIETLVEETREFITNLTIDIEIEEDYDTYITLLKEALG